MYVPWVRLSALKWMMMMYCNACYILWNISILVLSIDCCCRKKKGATSTVWMVQHNYSGFSFFINVLNSVETNRRKWSSYKDTRRYSLWAMTLWSGIHRTKKILPHDRNPPPPSPPKRKENSTSKTFTLLTEYKRHIPPRVSDTT